MRGLCSLEILREQWDRNHDDLDHVNHDNFHQNLDMFDSWLVWLPRSDDYDYDYDRNRATNHDHYHDHYINDHVSHLYTLWYAVCSFQNLP